LWDAQLGFDGLAFGRTSIRLSGGTQRPSAWLGMKDSNSEMSGQNIPLKGRTIIVAAARHRLPTIYPYRFFTVDGGLMSYASDVLDSYRRAASYVDRILRGAKVAELPVQQPIKYELTINVKTVKTLGLTVPDTLLARADEVIE
jgi:ABC-type uncharacterized transport system substrate-binding protein